MAAAESSVLRSGPSLSGDSLSGEVAAGGGRGQAKKKVMLPPPWLQPARPLWPPEASARPPPSKRRKIRPRGRAGAPVPPGPHPSFPSRSPLMPARGAEAWASSARPVRPASARAPQGPGPGRVAQGAPPSRARARAAAVPSPGPRAFHSASNSVLTEGTAPPRIDLGRLFSRVHARRAARSPPRLAPPRRRASRTYAFHRMHMCICNDCGVDQF